MTRRGTNDVIKFTVPGLGEISPSLIGIFIARALITSHHSMEKQTTLNKVLSNFK